MLNKNITPEMGTKIHKDFLIKEKSMSEDGNVLTIRGYANKFKSDNELVIDRSIESILPTAYDMENYKKNPVLLREHDMSKPVGVVKEILASGEGLYVVAEVHKELDNELFYAIKSGIVKAFSVGFIGKSFDWIGEGNQDVWLWTEVELIEISVVAIPDNQDSLFVVESAQKSICSLVGGNCKAMKKNINKKQSNSWKGIDKEAYAVAVKKLGDEFVSDAFLDGESRFPHHTINEKDGSIEFSPEGFISAINGLKGAIKDGADFGDINTIVKHIQGHLVSMSTEYRKEIAPFIAELVELSKKEVEPAQEPLQENEPVNGEEGTEPKEPETNQEPKEPETNQEPVNVTGTEQEPKEQSVSDIADTLLEKVNELPDEDGINVLYDTLTKLNDALNARANPTKD